MSERATTHPLERRYGRFSGVHLWPDLKCPPRQLTTASRFAYHHGMPGGQVYWTLVFTAANLEHLAERNVEAADVANAVYGEHGTARVRRSGSGARRRWFVVAPLEDGEL